MGLERVTYTDDQGRFKVVLMPQGSAEDPTAGIPLGPPNLESLGLPLDVEIALNNGLYHRGVVTQQDALRKRAEIIYALNSAFKVSAEKIVALYLGEGYKNASEEPTEVQPDKIVSNRRPR